MKTRKAIYKLKSLKPYDNNPRKINDRAVAAVKKSIEEYGYNVPIVVDSKRVILTGHTRLMALQELGWTEATVIVATDLSEEKAKQFRVIDNRVGEMSEWNEEMLRDEVRAIGSEEMDSFFESGELERLLKDLDESEAANNPTQEKIDKTQADSETKFTEKDREAHGNMIEVKCQCCDELFSVDKRIVL